jgi:hypothetical protein
MDRWMALFKSTSFASTLVDEILERTSQHFNFLKLRFLQSILTKLLLFEVMLETELGLVFLSKVC